jgi:unsaturated chondroitin disaccharide hydrolase
MMEVNYRDWIEETYQKLCMKFSAECDRIGDRIPYSPKNGKYVEDCSQTALDCWTNGFWPGILWQMYHATKEEKYKEAASKIEQKFDALFDEYVKLHHDVGFMWLHTAVASYRLTGEERSKVRGLHAANLLAGRYNPLGGFIRAWNEDRIGWIIIDCMMNIPLLYWAGRETKDPRFTAIAMKHADTAMNMLVREDGSCNHIAVLDPLSGERLETPAGQGFADGSAWSRGQAWGVYGFALSYHHTKEERYLNTAKRIAHYFIANLAENDWLPLCDFRAPEEPVYYDSTAGAIAACGFLEIAQHVPEHEKGLYVNAAYRTLKAMGEKWCNWNVEEDAVLGMGKALYHDLDREHHVPIIYGDYFYLEAVLRMMGKDILLW